MVVAIVDDVNEVVDARVFERSVDSGDCAIKISTEYARGRDVR